MTLATLENWNQTAFGLHRGVQLLGAVQRLTQDPQQAYLELALKVEQRGLFTGRLPSGEQVYLDFETPSLVYEAAGQDLVSFPLSGRSQADVFIDLFGRLEGEMEMRSSGDELFERVSSGIAARGGRYRAPQRATLLDETAIEIDERHPHMNFGFSPCSEGIETPYLYAYAYPYPARFEPPALPEGAYWHTRGWTGAMIPYDTIAGQADAAGYVEASCTAIYWGLLPFISGTV